MLYGLSQKVKMLVIGSCISVAILGATAIQTWSDYQETLSTQEGTVGTMAKVVEAHVNATASQAQTVLTLITGMIVEDGDPQMMQEPTRWRRLRGYCEGLHGCKTIGVVNPSGQIVALSDSPQLPTIDVSDRDYFRVPQNTGTLYIAPAVVSRLDKNPILFTIALPVYGETGEFLAVIAIGLTTEYLTDFYGLMAFGASPTVTVFKRNGDILARYPDMEKYVGKSNKDGPLFTRYLPKAESGTYFSESVLDGKYRIAAYRSIKMLDVVVYTGIEVDTALKAWKRRAMRAWLISLFALAIAAAALYWGYRSLIRESRLQKENKQLGELSMHDPLTGIANRRMFDSTLRLEWEQHKKTGKPLSMLIIDIDFFKKFNDLYGHQRGDECLRQVAQSIANALHRTDDLVARYGGEEFGVILNAGEEGATAVAERMRLAVQSLGITHGDSNVANHVTVSIGLSCTLFREFRTAEELIEAADKALYVAKESGRNRVSKSTMEPVDESLQLS